MFRARILPFVLLASGLTFLHSARADDAVQPEFYDHALAAAYGEKCPNWKVDWGRAADLLKEGGLDILTADNKVALARMVPAAAKAAERIEGLDEAEICRLAEAEFGPKGTRRANLMSDTLIVRGLNKLFDLLDSRN